MRSSLQVHGVRPRASNRNRVSGSLHVKEKRGSVRRKAAPRQLSFRSDVLRNNVDLAFRSHAQQATALVGIFTDKQVTPWGNRDIIPIAENIGIVGL